METRWSALRWASGDDEHRACTDRSAFQREKHEHVHIHTRCSQCVVHVSIAPAHRQEHFPVVCVVPLRAMNNAPPGPPRRGPGPPAPPFRVDREKVRRCYAHSLLLPTSHLCLHRALPQTCPLLLRVFPRVGGHHTPEDFPTEGPLPASEFQARRRTVGSLTPPLISPTETAATRRPDLYVA